MKVGSALRVDLRIELSKKKHITWARVLKTERNRWNVLSSSN